MSTPPRRPKIYHITHRENLPKIIATGGLYSDARCERDGQTAACIGLPEIKQRRLNLPVPCHPGTRVGEYVPFYFCPRSVMLYIIYCRNHPSLSYREGQGPVIHLEADLAEVVHWADANTREWAFSTSNAGAWYTPFFSTTNDLTRVDWNAVRARDFRDPVVKDGKQAEFLLYDSFPWELIRGIGVLDAGTDAWVRTACETAGYRPIVRVESGWYY